jgi:hypothetical protein
MTPAHGMPALHFRTLVLLVILGVGCSNEGTDPNGATSSSGTGNGSMGGGGAGGFGGFGGFGTTGPCYGGGSGSVLVSCQAGIVSLHIAPGCPDVVLGTCTDGCRISSMTYQGGALPLPETFCNERVPMEDGGVGGGGSNNGGSSNDAGRLDGGRGLDDGGSLDGGVATADSATRDVSN